MRENEFIAEIRDKKYIFNENKSYPIHYYDDEIKLFLFVKPKKSYGEYTGLQLIRKFSYIFECGLKEYVSKKKKNKQEV